MLIVGLTGSMGAGKSSVAAMFADFGAATYDADRAVHDLYTGRAVPLVEEAFPGVSENGAIDRSRLADRVAGDAEALARLESIVHPLVREAETTFLEGARAAGARLAVLEIPLLVETGAGARMDVVVTVTAPEAVRRERVMSRPGMDGARFRALSERQADDAAKRKAAHFVIDNGGSRDATNRQIEDFLRAVAGMTAAG